MIGMGFSEIKSHLSKFRIGIAGAGGRRINPEVLAPRVGIVATIQANVVIELLMNMI